MRTCARFIAAIFAVLFIISALAALLLYNIDAALLDADVYKKALIEEDIYARLPGIVGREIRYGMTYNPCLENPDQCEEDSGPGDPHAGPPAYFRILSEDDWEQLIATLLEPEWLQTTVESALDQVFENLNSRAPPDPISISLAELKAKVAGPGGFQALQALLEKQPDCTSEQIGQLFEAKISGGGMDDFLLCNPPEILKDVVDPIMRDALQSAASGIPEELTFEIPYVYISGSTGKWDLRGDPITSFFAVRRFLRLTPIVPIAFLLLVTIFAVRSIRDWLLWWGVPLLSTGAVALAVSLLSFLILGWLVPRLLGEAAPQGLSPEVISIATDLGVALFRQVMRKIMIQAGVILAIGFSFAISAFFVRHERIAVADSLSE